MRTTVDIEDDVLIAPFSSRGVIVSNEQIERLREQEGI